VCALTAAVGKWNSLTAQYLKIIAAPRYLQEIGELSLGVQENIQEKWMEVTEHVNPRDVGQTASCGKPYAKAVLDIFPGIACEFVYEANEQAHEIWLLSCKRLTFLDHGQID
jgi:hypothetical protein